MWQRVRTWGVKTWAVIAATIAIVIGLIIKILRDRDEANSATTVATAATTKTDAEFRDGTAAAAVLAAATATEVAVTQEVAAAVAAGPPGSDARLEAIDASVSAMSRQRHEEALRRAGKL